MWYSGNIFLRKKIFGQHNWYRTHYLYTTFYYLTIFFLSSAAFQFLQTLICLYFIWCRIRCLKFDAQITQIFLMLSSYGLIRRSCYHIWTAINYEICVSNSFRSNTWQIDSWNWNSNSSLIVFFATILFSWFL